jgi:diaminopimelate epimerase
MKFTKMQGAGNDYVYVDCTQGGLENPEKLAVRLSDRHFGIGADGLILIKRSENADFYMEMYNADGSQGQMCGNGIRCVGKYVYDNALTDKTNITVETLAGVKMLELKPGSDGLVESVRVDMGAPILRASKIPVNITRLHNNFNNDFHDAADGKNTLVTGLSGAKDAYDLGNEPVISAPIEVKGDLYNITCVSMGNPHAVVLLGKSVEMDRLKIEEIGPAFENHPAFPERVNTEFIQVKDRENIYMRVWERGSGETLACGTGACASLVAAVLNGLCDEKATLHLLGGDVSVSWDRLVNRVYLEGAAVKVFEGEIDI